MNSVFPHWVLDPEEIKEAESLGFSYAERGGRFRLHRSSDGAMIWPHIDAFISVFVRQGHFVKHKRYYDLQKAMRRRFGDAHE